MGTRRPDILFHLNTGDLELLTKIGGIAGAAFAALKVSITYAVDQTLNRKAAKTVDEIDAFLGRLVKLEDEKAIIQTPTLEEYKLQVEEDLQARLRTLEAIRAQKRRRAVRRNEEPKGIQRWLLLYRPEGFDGLIIQSLYYVFSLAIVLLVIEVPIVLVVRHLEGWVIVPGILVYVLIALYLRSVSLRLKSVGNAVRLKPIKHPNSDIGWLRRNLLILKKGDGLWALRVLYYIFLVEPVYIWSQLSDVSQRPPFLSRSLTLVTAAWALLFAQVFKADALSRRARAYLSSQSASNSQNRS